MGHSVPVRVRCGLGWEHRYERDEICNFERRKRKGGRSGGGLGLVSSPGYLSLSHLGQFTAAAAAAAALVSR